MVVQKGGVFCELQNTMDLLGQEKYSEHATEGNKTKACRGVDEVQERTVETLQSAFLKFKRNRQNKLQQLAVIDKRLKQHVRSTEQIDKLREKFVEQAKTYLGVPYARQYHKPGSPEYDAPLFLDCCGLVRKVLRDMKEDFGFSVGPWNQAYMFDTLPNTIEDVKDLKHGDLVFVSGTFYDPKRRKHRHNMVHVEIWAGDGERTIGARWQKGQVQIHDSYRYVSKSYYNMVYHFKSIDTWLNGVCKSFCSQHPWKSSSFIPEKRSIFSMTEADQPAEDSAEDKCATEFENCGEADDKDFGGNFDDKVKEHCGVIGGGENSVYVGKDMHVEGKNVCREEETVDWKGNRSYVDQDFAGVDNEENVFIVEKNECKDEIEAYGSEEKTSAETQGQMHNGGGLRSSFENACFCKLCITDSDPSENLFSSVKTTEEKEYFASPKFANTSDDFSFVDKVVQVSSRPNTGGSGAGGTRKQGMQATQTAHRRGKGGTRRGNGEDDETNIPRKPSRPLCRPKPSLTRLHQKSPTFFIGGHNGAKMVEATLSSLGWERIHDNNDRTFYLKWVECKRNLDFSSFREGEQLVNHIPNGNLLTTKIGLLTSLQEFGRVNNKVASPTRRGIQMNDFVPETYKLQNQTEIHNFIHHIYQDGEMWICKPTGMNQGKGIFLIRTRDELLEKLGSKTQGRQRCFPSPGRVIQRYILNPFLLNGYKADIRTYMLIAGTCPYMVFYHPGYVRLSLVPYSLHQEEVHAHLTNQYIQKKHPLYEQVKEETVWSLEQLQEYINKTSNNTLPNDWVFSTFTKRMQEIMLHCFQSVRYKLERKLGYFDLLGFDFMLDENFKVWLIEINVNPALHTNCTILSGVIPELVDTTLKLVLEVFEKSRRREQVIPLENLGKFQLLFSDDKK